MSDPLTAPPALVPPPAPAQMPVAVPPPPRKSSRSLSWLLAVAGLIAVAGIAFAGGRLTAPAAAAGRGNGFPNGFPGASFRPGGGLAGGFGNRGFGSISLRGTVSAVSSDSITITLDNGTSVTVPLDAQTTYHQSSTANAAAVTVGSTVAIEPGTTTFQPGASPNPSGGQGGLTFGPASDVTVVAN